MQATKMNSSYDLRVSDLFAVASVVGGAHYLSGLLSDYQTTLSISGALNSANVGVTAAIGALVYCAYRFFWSISR